MPDEPMLTAAEEERISAEAGYSDARATRNAADKRSRSNPKEG